MSDGANMWTPERRDELLGTPTGDERGGPEEGITTAQEHLLATRAISAARARRVVDTGRCDECRCALGAAAAHDDCECPCHCDCCCPPLAHCMHDCACACDCHYEINDSDEDGDRETQVEAAQRLSSEHLQSADSQAANDDIVLETPTSATGSTPASQPRAGQANTQQEHVDEMSEDDLHEDGQAQGPRLSSTNAGATRTAPGERNDALSEQGPSDEDEEMNGTAPLRRSLEKLSIGQLATLLAKNLPLTDEQAEINSRRVTKSLFTQVYKSALAGGKPNKNANAHLPETTPDEDTLLYAYLTTLNNQLRYTTTRLTAALKDVAVAAVRSAWTLTRILEDRIALARTPRAPPVNVWSQPSGTEGAVNKLMGATIFRFDSTVYSASEADRLRAICEQEHVFAATTRVRTEDEWTIMQGLMSGSVIARVLPQFLKRCTTLAQIVWIHEEIMQRAEGELWVSLPALSQMYNYNQTTRRLAGEIRQAAIHQKWTDSRLEQMMTTVKSIAYNPVMHAIHFYFYTKAEATRWEGMLIPFRTTKLRLNNPDTRLNSSKNEHGLPTDEDDGLVNDRYQAHYKLRLGNLSRTMNLAALVRFLQKLTNHGLKSCMPLDTYGPHAEGSVLWDFISQTAECPEQLRNVYRIDWNGHMISVHHRPDTSPPPCLQCAQVGHQAAKCATPQEEWNITTITVSSHSIHQLSTAQPAWKTREELQKIFEGLATPREPESSLAPVTKNESTEIPRPQPADSPTPTPEPAQPIPTSTAAASQSPPSRTAPTSTADESTEWTTVRHKAHSSSTTLPADSSGPGQPPPTAATAAPSPSKPQGINTNTFINLVDDDDDDDSDYEDERAPDHPGTPPLESSTTPDPQQPDAPTAAADDDLIQRAVHRAQNERLRDILFNMIHQQDPLHDPSAISEAIQKALPHVAPKTSCAWLLEAIAGRLTETPSTGNCQNYATIEALFQKDMKYARDTEPMLVGTMILKYGAYLAHLSGSDAERRNTALTAILDVEEGTPTDRTPAEEAKTIAKFFKDLACSGSQLSDILPKRLWGCLDTIRMFSSFLGIPIFLVTATSDPTVCYLNVFRQRKNKAGAECTAISQPGVADWLAELEAESKRANCAPVVLVHNNAHYNCVIFDRHNPANVRPAPKKLKTPTIDMLWKAPTLDEILEGTKTKTTPERTTTTKPAKTTKTIKTTKTSKMIKTSKNTESAEIPPTTGVAGVSRREVLASDARITDADMMGFLAETGWTQHEMAEITSILVAGATNYRELLTFSAVSQGSSNPTPASNATADPDPNSSTSEYDPRSDTSEGESEPSQAYSLPLQGSEDYRAWAATMWEGVRQEWHAQLNQTLPALADTAALASLITEAPDDLFEAGRWCSNPFALLDHLTTRYANGRPRDGVATASQGFEHRWRR